MKDLKISDAAKAAGVSRQRLQTLCNEGKLDFFKERNRVWIKGNSLLHFINNKQETKTIEKSGKKGEPDAIIESDFLPNSSFAKVELAIKAEKYKAQKILNAIKEKKYIPLDEVETRGFEFSRTYRDKLQALPKQIVYKMRGSDSDHEALVIAEKAVHDILLSISNNYSDDEDLKKKTMARLIGR
jgi:hypothetical protein